MKNKEITLEDLARMTQTGFCEINKKMETGFRDADKRMDGMEKRMEGMEKRMDGMEKSMDGMAEKMRRLDNGQDEIKHELKKITQGEIRELNRRVLLLERKMEAI